MTVTRASILKNILMLVTKIILSKCEICLIYASKKKIYQLYIHILCQVYKEIDIDFQGYIRL